jgi:DNA polymerase eta
MLPDDTATWVYNVIRGVEKGAVSPRSTIKSMLSAKSFREPHLPSCFAEGQAWLKVFVADIASRINDDEVCRRPKNMTISFTNKASGSRNRQTAIPSGIGQVGAAVLLKTAEELLKRVAEGAWPCERLSILVGGFEEKEEGNRGIGDFLVKRPPPVSQLSIPTLTPQTPQIDPNTSPNNNTISQDQNLNKRKFPLCHDTDKAQTSVCTECDSQIPIWKAEQHKDWHFAKNLAKQDRLSALPPPPQSQPSLALRKSGRPPGGGGSSSRKKGRKEAQSGGGRLEKGQRTLNF